MKKSKLSLRSVQLGTARGTGEGLRIGTVRYLPRGVRKEDYAEQNFFDVWLPTLAPSRDLLSEVKSEELPIERFFARYRSEMSKTEPRQVIQLLAEMATRTPISVGCYCADESCCHRSVLTELIREAGGEVIAPPVLSATCIYTIAHTDKLSHALAAKTPHTWEESRTWAEGKRLFDQSQSDGESMPIIFADATDCSKLTHWAILQDVHPSKEKTRYTFTDMCVIPDGRTPQELTLCSTGQTIAAGYIRPYAVCKTPKFLR